MNEIQAEHGAGSNDDTGGSGIDDGNNGIGDGDDTGDDDIGGSDDDTGEGSGETIGYADAMAELERILRDLEGDDLDVDMLASRVERASFLIGLCRTRIGAARVQVERVVANLDSDDDEYGVQADSEPASEPEADGD